MDVSGMRALLHAPPAETAGVPGRPSRTRVAIAAAEMTATTLLIVVYFLIRGAHPDDVPQSVRRALDIVDFEQGLHVFHEQDVQSWFTDSDAVIDFANTFYVWGMYPLIVAVAIWLSYANLPYFRFVRNVMLVSAVIGIAGYWLVPTAPPRLLAAHGYDFGFVDTVHGSSRDLQPAPFLNEYAAMPSFHFAWVLLASIAIWSNARWWWLKLAGAAASAVMAWAVVVTGNHFFLDMVVGVVALAAAWVVTRLAYMLDWTPLTAAVREAGGGWLRFVFARADDSDERGGRGG